MLFSLPDPSKGYKLAGTGWDWSLGLGLGRMIWDNWRYQLLLYTCIM